MDVVSGRADWIMTSTHGKHHKQETLAKSSENGSSIQAGQKRPRFGQETTLPAQAQKRKQPKHKHFKNTRSKGRRHQHIAEHKRGSGRQLSRLAETTAATVVMHSDERSSAANDCKC